MLGRFTVKFTNKWRLTRSIAQWCEAFAINSLQCFETSWNILAKRPAMSSNGLECPGTYWYTSKHFEPQGLIWKPVFLWLYIASKLVSTNSTSVFLLTLLPWQLLLFLWIANNPKVAWQRCCCCFFFYSLTWYSCTNQPHRVNPVYVHFHSSLLWLSKFLASIHNDLRCLN